MAQNDELIITTLLEIKEDIGGLSADVKGIKVSLDKNDDDHTAFQDQTRRMESSIESIQGQIVVVKDLESRLNKRIDGISGDVKAIKEMDLPAIKDQLVVGKWLASGRNKVLALIGVGLLGAAGNALAGLIRESVKISIVRPEGSATQGTQSGTVFPHWADVAGQRQQSTAIDLDAKP